MAYADGKRVEEEILKEFGEEYIHWLCRYVYEMVTKFIQVHRLEKSVYLNTDIAKQCLLDILVDIKRLRHFHEIKQETALKCHAYCASWWLKRKPLQLLDSTAKGTAFVNERFAMEFLLHALDRDLFDSKAYNQEKAAKIPSHLLYHLKYRNTNPQTLELFLTGLNTTL